jgi:threonine/homoserine/homoserine lactone efflux protein
MKTILPILMYILLSLAVLYLIWLLWHLIFERRKNEAQVFEDYSAYLLSRANVRDPWILSAGEWVSTPKKSSSGTKA